MCVDGSTSAKSRDVKSLDENEKLMYIKSDWRFKMLIWIEKIHGPLWKSIQPNENLRKGIGSYCILLVNGSKIAKKLVCDELWWNTKENSMIMDLFIFLVNNKKKTWNLDSVDKWMLSHPDIATTLKIISIGKE